jgi:hypothetical protein
MKRTTLLFSTMLFGMSLLASGCVAVVIAGAAAGAGTYVWANGKMSFETDHSIRECHSAATSALNELQIDIKNSMLDSLIAKIVGRTAVDEPVVVDIEPIDSRRTRVEVRVGTWGNKTQSRIILDGIQRHLY